MKSIYLIVAILIIVGGIMWSEGQKSSPVETNSEQMDTTAPTDTMDTMEEDGAVKDEAMGGTDVGMEMPIMDMPDTNEMMAGTQMFHISGRNFAFSPSEIRVKEGDTVTIHFMNTDGFHDWVIDEFSAATEVIKTGETTQITFVADKKGTFEFYCSVGQHRENGMKGKLVVE